MSEDALLASGVSHYKYQRFDLYRVNPPLVRLLASLPVKNELLSQESAWWRYDTSPLKRSEFTVGIDVVRRHPDYKLLIFRSRILIALFFGLIGTLTCYFYSKQFSGLIPAFLTLLLWCFSPYVLGHGSTIMNDVPSAVFAMTSVYFFWKWLKHPEMLESFIAGIILGLAELTKFTLLIFYPLFVFLWILYRIPEFKLLSRQDWFQQLKQIVIIFAISLLIINMGYLFEDAGKQLGTFKFQTTFFTGYENIKDIPISGANRFENTLLGTIPVPLPANYIQGIDTQRLDFERGLPSYLRAEWSDHGWWYYYLYALLIKTPLGTIGLFLLAIFCTFFQKNYNISWRDEMVILLPGIVLLVFVSSQTGFSVHSRYAIPALPFFFIWMSKIGKVFSLRKRFLQVLVLILLFWSIFSSLWVYPHSISYFNELAAILPTHKEQRSPQEPEGTPFIVSLLNAGSRNGGRHLLDSNIDWGQDLFYLEKWCLQHPEITEISTAIYGSYPLEQTKIPAKSMPPINDPQPGWYALSVNYIYNREKQYQYFLNFEPVAMAGYSIYIYYITQDGIDKSHQNKGNKK
jgi:hypothetical protein